MPAGTTRKVRAVKMNSKNKGNTFERKIATTFSARFESKTIKSSFRRNVDSGSYFGGSNQTRLKTHDTTKANLGDLVCPAAFRYTIECKHYKTPPSFNSIMQQDCKQWNDWLAQAEQDSANCQKKLLLIIKYNNMPEMVILKDPVPNVFNMPYQQYFVIKLTDLLIMEDSTFFE